MLALVEVVRSLRARARCWPVCGSPARPAHSGALQGSHGDQCLLDSKRVLPAHHGCGPGSSLHHSIEGTTAVAANPWQCLCGWDAPALGRVRGHEQGTAAVS